jgi:DNA-binding NtrC family response regulator
LITIGPSGEKQLLFKLGETEADLIRQLSELALDNNSWNITKAAKSIGINRTTLAMRLSKWGLSDESETKETVSELQAPALPESSG